MTSAYATALTQDLLTGGRKVDPACPVRGFCYTLSEALYWLYYRTAGYRPHVGRVPGGGTHWWLQDRAGHIVDATSAQFDAETLVSIYSVGRACGFLTGAPSKRARQLMARIEQQQGGADGNVLGLGRRDHYHDFTF